MSNTYNSGSVVKKIVQVDNIPAELKALPFWCCWKYEYKKNSDKPTKVPYQSNGAHACSDNPALWEMFDECYRVYAKTDRFDGIGFFLADGYAGIDFDHCIADGVINEWAKKVVNALDSYAEISPSGTGVKVLVKGKVPKGTKREQIEIYSDKRFFTITGQKLENSPNTVNDAQEQIDRLYMTLNPPREEPEDNLTTENNCDLADEEFIKRCKKSHKNFKALFDGNWASVLDEDGKKRYESASNADMGLLCMLASHTHDVARIDRIYRQSGLFRGREDKWERLAGAQIQRAIGFSPITDDFSKENAKGKFDSLAEGFVKDCLDRGEVPLFTGNRVYFYKKNHYEECVELPMRVRQYFSVRGLSQSNNVIGNVTPIVQSLVWKDAMLYGELPYWSDNTKIDPKNIIAFKNGLLDITEYKLLSHSPAWCSTVCLPFNYDPKASCPLWEKFLGQVLENDVDRIALLQEFIGYCLTSDTSLQKALILVGKSRSGKGTIQRIIARLIGVSCAGFSLDRLATEFGLSSLVNKSVAIVGEVELAGSKDKAKIVEIWKSAIGEDIMSINEKHNPKFLSMRLPTRFVVATNSLPRLMDASGALATRLLFVPFEVSFAGREDSLLEDRLAAELSGIANWALAGLQRLRANNGRFTLGQAHKTQSENFVADTSPVLGFIRECVVVHESASSGDLPVECLSQDRKLSILKSELYAQYVNWCDVNDNEPASAVWFARDFLAVLPKVEVNKRRYCGVALRLADPKWGGMGGKIHCAGNFLKEEENKKVEYTMENTPHTPPVASPIVNTSAPTVNYTADQIAQIINKPYEVMTVDNPDYHITLNYAVFPLFDRSEIERLGIMTASKLIHRDNRTWVRIHC